MVDIHKMTLEQRHARERQLVDIIKEHVTNKTQIPAPLVCETAQLLEYRLVEGVCDMDDYGYGHPCQYCHEHEKL